MWISNAAQRTNLAVDSTDFLRFFHGLYPGSEDNFGGAALAFVQSRLVASALLLANYAPDVSTGSGRSVAVR